jgi:hypothetical protein
MILYIYFSVDPSETGQYGACDNPLDPLSAGRRDVRLCLSIHDLVASGQLPLANLEVCTE